FIVAANHASHLDMGLVKMALEAAGEDLVALAAADYFFDTIYKRAYMENFTNLVPMERSGSLRQSLRHARSFLDRGYNALIFPKGSTILKSREVGARIGRFIEHEELESMTSGLSRAEAYRLIAARVRHDVVNLRDRTNIKFDPQVIHEEWQAERRAGKLRIEASDEEFAAAEA